MNKNKDKKVTKEEFKKFIKIYFPKLEFNCYGAYDPPLITYNDFSNNKKWPDSVVAYYVDAESYKGTDLYHENEYYIKCAN